MCSLAPLLWRSFFVCIVFGCRILRILYQARYFFPKLTYRPKSGATDGGHAPELSSTALSNHDLFAWKLETTQSTSSQYHNIIMPCTSSQKYGLKEHRRGLLFTCPRIEDLHPTLLDCIELCYVLVLSLYYVQWSWWCLSVERVNGSSWWTTSASCVRWFSHLHHAGRAGVIKLGQRSRKKNRWRTPRRGILLHSGWIMRNKYTLVHCAAAQRRGSPGLFSRSSSSIYLHQQRAK